MMGPTHASLVSNRLALLILTGLSHMPEDSSRTVGLSQLCSMCLYKCHPLAGAQACSQDKGRGARESQSHKASSPGIPLLPVNKDTSHEHNLDSRDRGNLYLFMGESIISYRKGCREKEKEF